MHPIIEMGEIKGLLSMFDLTKRLLTLVGAVIKLRWCYVLSNCTEVDRFSPV